ncbi:MAG: hypothetical protein CVU55_07130 [Deltaproteobacteria bacterium HGW-Deltaproteobacteria-13]|jgi:hypothetical protein|nr:MAG: hypothetical protein CVU55_07130 [Deltaproteobacteria bacterium HGW-Deltaproteobacteria-13]
MDKTKDSRTDYIQFLSNPQSHGVWSLTIQPEAASTEALRTLLNLREMPLYKYRYYGVDEDSGPGIPAFIVPKLFAYLRYCMPKKKGQDIPQLFLSERELWARRHGMPRHRYIVSRFLHEITEEPKRLGPEKKRSLASALGVFKTGFHMCSIEAVPDNPSALDIFCEKDNSYFQVSEDFEGRITIYALQEETCLEFKRLFAALPNFRFTCESRKVFSPESQLLAMYMPSLKITMPRKILRDSTVLKTISQTLSEAREGRFVHAIRAIGIGAEELIVEVFETYLHDKAPEAPLGNLLAELNSRIQDIQNGAKPKTKSPSGNVKKSLGTIISSEKKGAGQSTRLCSLCEILLQEIVPTIEQLASKIGDIEEITARPQKTIIFPAHVNRSLSDLVPLRNRVSHRVDRLGASHSVTYLESALALKSYIVLALWWQEERKQIDYRVGAKEAIKKAVDRNRIVVE